MPRKIALSLDTDWEIDSDPLSLADWSDDIDLHESGWQMLSAPSGSASVVDVLRLAIRGSTRTAIDSRIHEIEDKLRQIEEAKFGAERYGTWLHFSRNGEYLGRTFLFAGRVGPFNEEGQFIKYKSGSYYYLVNVPLTLERSPFFEGYTPIPYMISAVSTVGGVSDYTTYGGSPGAVYGDAAARIGIFKLTRDSVGGTVPLHKFWAGFRTNRFGNRTNFQSYWSLRKAVAFSADTTGGTSHADATAKDGYKAICTFGSSTSMGQRLLIQLGDVTANPGDQRGAYLVLLRAKMSGAGEARVRLKDGWRYTDTGSFRVQPRVSVASTSWYMYELGTVQIPSPGRLPYDTAYTTASIMKAFALALDAERVSGSSSLEMDCLILIPTEEGYVSVDAGDSIDDIGAEGALYSHHRPDDSRDGLVAIDVGAGVFQPVRAVHPGGAGGLPLGSGVVVLAAQQETVSVLTQTARLDVSIFPRWKTFPGD